MKPSSLLSAGARTLACLTLASCCTAAPFDDEAGAPLDGLPFQTPDQPGLDTAPPPVARDHSPKASGPIAPAGTQPSGAMSGRVVFTSGGHGWVWGGSSWSLQRGVVQEMNEDYGNVDQMSLFAWYCFNAGATVVAMRPIGNQTNEVVLDNDSPGVSFSAGWADSASTVYYGSAGDVAYRYASVAATETAVATYVPTLPAAGFYPVYTWVLHSSNRTNQLYRIRHTGGESQVRIPHHQVGNGWIYLGTYYFNAGSNAPSGAVLISNFVPGAGGSVVIADAIRFGNGMGSIDRGGGVSRYPREEESNRYWVQNSLGVGQSANIADGSGDDGSDNVGSPIRMAAEMNRETTGNLFKRAYVGFHSNASGVANPTARGVTGLYNDETLFPGTGTSNQFILARTLAQEINDDLVGIAVPPLELAWKNRGSNLTYARDDYAFGEIRGDVLDYEMDATIVEVAFHDEPNDAKLLRDPKVRNWVARSTYQGLLRYFNQFDAAPLTFLPEPPWNVRAVATNSGVIVAWNAPLAQGGSGNVGGYVVYASTNGYGFGSPVGVGGAGTLSVLFTNFPADTTRYFRVAATNSGGESLPSETVGCRLASNPALRRALVVNAFDRFERSLNLRQTPSAQNYKPPGHDGNSGTMERVLPRRSNAFDYAVPHGEALGAAGVPFDSCQNDAIGLGNVRLTNYAHVVWCCGNESTADETFSSAEQTQVTDFQQRGGNLFVSGSEIGWDLDRDSGPTAADRSFIRGTLHATLTGNTNDNSGIYTFAPSAGGIFTNNATGTFDDGSRGIYCVGYPDVLNPYGPGASTTLSYPGLGRGAAAVQYNGSAGGGKVVFLGFPFETITTTSTRNELLADALKFFRLPPRLTGIEWLASGRPRLSLSGEPGAQHTLLTSTNLTSWSTLTSVVTTNGTATVEDSLSSPGARRFYRVLMP